MSIEIKNERNYAATVIRVPELEKAQNSDRLYIIRKFGMTAIVDESWKVRVGQLALIFPAEAQLSEQFARANNLFRHAELNADPSQVGYLDDNRRIRALKLRGNISNALALPEHSVYTHDAAGGGFGGYLQEGDVFDTYAGQEICRKYVLPVKAQVVNRAGQKQKRVLSRVDSTFLPEHFDTSHWDREEGRIPGDARVIVTQKLHGSSVRLANTIVRRKLSWLERVAKRLGVNVRETEYDLVAGSRKVIKDPNNPDQNHYYDEDIWTEALEEYGGLIPQGHVVYGELVGFTRTGRPIQPGHTYECAAPDASRAEPGGMSLYVYRVAVVTEAGGMVDLSWSQVRGFCERQGFDHVPELGNERKEHVDMDEFVERHFFADHKQLPFTDQPVNISAGGTGKDEGVVLRVENGLEPEFFKMKNQSHYLYETKQLDSGEADIESQQS